MTNDEMIACLQAENEGKQLQYDLNGEGQWCDLKISAVFKDSRWRIKPEPREVWVSISETGDVLQASRNVEFMKAFSKDAKLFREVI